MIYVNGKSLFYGVNETMFAPKDYMTRAMFAVILSRLDAANLDSYTTSVFEDVDIESWYGKAVMWAKDSGIINGYGNGLFNPAKSMTREEIAVMLAKYIEYRGLNLPTEDKEEFNDITSISEWAVESVRTVQAFGIMNGMGNNLFNPKLITIRSEIAQIFMNLGMAIDELNITE